MPADGSVPRPALADTDRCVKCGLCLPHCPTYVVRRDEGDSPRGRITLMQALAAELPATPRLQAHLDGCLACRACEAVCPADVPYGPLIDAAREEMARRHPAHTLLPRLVAAAMSRRWLRVLVLAPFWLYQRSGVQAAVRHLHLLGRGRLARLDSLLPRIAWPRRRSPAGAGTTVALFTNCVSPFADAESLDAATRLLAALGHRVTVPPAQTCCGALHQHNGLPDGARACAHRNAAAFAGDSPVVGIASGCTAQLVEYPLLSGDGSPAASLAARTSDVHAFLVQRLRERPLSFRPLDARVLLHTPCTMRNVLCGERAVRELLERIPGLRIEALDPACCGAAGSYFVTQPAMADRLLEPKLEAIRRARPDFVLTSNVGCALHFDAALRRAGFTVPVWHPVRLLAQQLEPPPAAG
ncbi:MAG TPA: (Fe-S)-binding protein [Candidatus Binatia bacterium]|nr:(Fe-S)-binding protein [Candidatus Binatia bacterium]